MSFKKGPLKGLFFHDGVRKMQADAA